MVTIENQTNLTINHDLIHAIALTVTSREIELVICDNPTIQQYNHDYRKKDKPTDVLSFPVEGEFEHLPLGTIIVSVDFVVQQANHFGHSKEYEFALLFIHGLLHLLGYDHECDNGEMRSKEEALIREFHLPTSLIVRTENS